MMAHSAMLFNFLVNTWRSMLQDNSLPFSRPYLEISVLASFKLEIGHMTSKVGMAANNVKVYNIFWSQALHCYYCWVTWIYCLTRSLIALSTSIPPLIFLVVKFMLATRIRLHRLQVLRHAAELSKVILSVQCSENTTTKSVLLVVSDGGLDHRLSYGTVQTSLLALFIRQTWICLLLSKLAQMCHWKEQPWRNWEVEQ